MWAHEPAQYVVQSDEQVMQGYGGEQVFVPVQKSHGLAGGDVLQNDVQPRMFPRLSVHHGQKEIFAIQHETAAFAVYQKR